jgi:hypothetical protein
MTAEVKVETRVSSIPELEVLIKELARQRVDFQVRWDGLQNGKWPQWTVTREELA